VVPHVELPDILGFGPILAFGFDVDLPLAAEPVEVVHKRSTHKSLDGPVDVVDGHSLLEDLIFVHVDKLLRDARKKGGAQARYFRTFTGCSNELTHVGCEKRHVVARPILENKRESARGPHS